jgi:hypothetical protein
MNKIFKSSFTVFPNRNTSTINGLGLCIYPKSNLNRGIPPLAKIRIAIQSRNFNATQIALTIVEVRPKRRKTSEKEKREKREKKEKT